MVGEDVVSGHPRALETRVLDDSLAQGVCTHNGNCLIDGKVVTAHTRQRGEQGQGKTAQQQGQCEGSQCKSGTATSPWQPVSLFLFCTVSWPHLASRSPPDSCISNTGHTSAPLSLSTHVGLHTHVLLQDTYTHASLKKANVSFWPFDPSGKLLDPSVPLGALVQSLRPVLKAIVGTRLGGI